MPSYAKTYDGGKFMKLALLQGQPPAELTIKGVRTVTLRERNRLELSFRESDRALTLNKTSASALALAYGDETDGWVGKGVRIFAGRVPFGTGMAEAILAEPLNGRGQGTGDRGEGTARPPGQDVQAVCTILSVDKVQTTEKATGEVKELWWINLSTGIKAGTRNVEIARRALDAVDMGEVAAFYRPMGKAFQFLGVQAPPNEKVNADLPGPTGDEIPF